MVFFLACFGIIMLVGFTVKIKIGQSFIFFAH